MRESILFTPAYIGRTEIRNRFVRSATAERMAEPDGSPTSQMADTYLTLAKGGIGLIMTGHMFVEEKGRAHYRMTGIHTDKMIPKLRKLSDAAHRGGAKIFVQINHAGCYAPKEIVGEPVAPSPIKLRRALTTPHELTAEEIGHVVEKFALASKRAVESGFDGVQIHAAHGYLVNQFLSPVTNHRTDAWGGDFVRRQGFLKEICSNVRAAVGNDFPVITKLGVEDTTPGGTTVAEGAAIAVNLKEWGIDGIEVSGGLEVKGSSSMRTKIQEEEDEAYFAQYAAAVRERTDITLALVGGLRSFAVMEQLVSQGTADFVSVSRPLVRDPELINKFRRGDLDKAECISCNSCWPPEMDASIGCKQIR